MEGNSEIPGVPDTSSFEELHHNLMSLADKLFKKNHVFRTEELLNLAMRNFNYEKNDS